MINLSTKLPSSLILPLIIMTALILSTPTTSASAALKHCLRPNTTTQPLLPCIIDDQFINATLVRTEASLEMRLRNRSVKLLNVPDVMQATEYTCGPSSLSAVLAYYQKYYRESQLAKLAKTQQEYGTGPRNLLAAIKSLGISATLYQQMSILDIQNNINANRPIIVQIQAWSDTPQSYITDFQDGHYVVVIGYDDTYLYFEDPWILGSITYMNKREFTDRWHDAVHSQSRIVYNLGIVVNQYGYSHPNVIKLE